VNISNPRENVNERCAPRPSLSRDIKRYSPDKEEIPSPPLNSCTATSSQAASCRCRLAQEIPILLGDSPQMDSRGSSMRARVFARTSAPRNDTRLEIRLSILNSQIRARAKVLVNSHGAHRDSYVMPNESTNLTRSLARTCTRGSATGISWRESFT